jgi:hypothetical protein
VLGADDLHATDSSALDIRKQNPSKTVPDGGTQPAFKRLDRDTTKTARPHRHILIDMTRQLKPN